MKAELNEHGVLNISPETPLEVFALNEWVKQSFIQMQNETLSENSLWRGSKMLVNLQQAKDAE